MNFGADGFGAIIQPYQTTIQEGETFSVTVEIKNPFHEEKEAIAKIIAPKGWQIETTELRKNLSGNKSAQFKTAITVPKGTIGFRERIAVDLTVGDHHFGQHAEALVTIYQK
jgi:uncharacterized membrane protein